MRYEDWESTPPGSDELLPNTRSFGRHRSMRGTMPPDWLPWKLVRPDVRASEWVVLATKMIEPDLVSK
jgi:hypothetical protein